jgi:hypothetical protein
VTAARGTWLAGFETGWLTRACLEAFRPLSLQEYAGDREMQQHIDLVWDGVQEEVQEFAARHWITHAGVDAVGIDVKLVYDTFVWRHVLSRFSVGSHPAVLELLPGQSRTILFALSSAGIRCDLHRLDRDVSRFRGEVPQGSSMTRWRADLHDAEVSWEKFRLVVGNHTLDDLLMVGWAPDRYVETFGRAAEWERLWKDFDCSSERGSLIESTARRIRDLAFTLQAGSRLILREYPAAFAVLNGIREQISIHEEAFDAVKNLLASLPGDLTVVDLSALPVPAISRTQGTLIVYTSAEPPAPATRPGSHSHPTRPHGRSS